MHHTTSGVVIVNTRIRYGRLEIFLSAPVGTHHSTMRSVAVRHAKAQPAPEYVSPVSGPEPGMWGIPDYGGEWRPAIGTENTRRVRKLFVSMPMPAE